MKIEKRGKYAGVKVHLEPEECEAFVAFAADAEKAGLMGKKIPVNMSSFSLSAKLGKKIKNLMEDEPALLKERTPEEIQHELEVEYESAALKLKALAKGKDWKEIHIK